MQNDYTRRLRDLRALVGRNIRNLRTEQKMPLCKLARHTGVPEKMLDHYELGKSEIRLHEILKIALAFGVETLDLMRQDDSFPLCAERKGECPL